VTENLNRAPVAPVADLRPASGSVLLRAWRGEAHLSQVFWVIFFRGFAVVFFLSFILFGTFGRTAPVITTVAVITYTVLFSSFVLVSVYRCASRTAQLGWGTLASLVVILASGVVVVLSLHGLQVHQMQDRLRRALSAMSPSNPALDTDALKRVAACRARVSATR
jgi:hypothetical protein